MLLFRCHPAVPNTRFYREQKTDKQGVRGEVDGGWGGSSVRSKCCFLDGRAGHPPKVSQCMASSVSPTGWAGALEHGKGSMFPFTIQGLTVLLRVRKPEQVHSENREECPGEGTAYGKGCMVSMYTGRRVQHAAPGRARGSWRDVRPGEGLWGKGSGERPDLSELIRISWGTLATTRV